MKITTYREEYDKKLIDHMAAGFSFESFGAVVSAGRTTIYEWIQAHPTFKEAKAEGEARALMFFENVLMRRLLGKNKEYDPYLAQFALRTRFHKVYGERNKVQVDESDEDDLEFT